MSMTESEPKKIKVLVEGGDRGAEKALKAQLELLEELEEYRAIGTVSEFRELKEKATAKKVIYRKQSYGTPWLCPNCEADQVKVEFMSADGIEPKKKHTFCWKCGCCIDWSEGKE